MGAAAPVRPASTGSSRPAGCLPRRQQRAADGVRPGDAGHRLPADPALRRRRREGGRHRDPAHARRAPSAARRTCSSSATTATSSSRWETCLDGRRVGVIGFVEFRNTGLSSSWPSAGWSPSTSSHDVRAFNEQLPRVRIIPDRRVRPRAEFLRGRGRRPSTKSISALAARTKGEVLMRMVLRVGDRRLRPRGALPEHATVCQNIWLTERSGGPRRCPRAHHDPGSDL